VIHRLSDAHLQARTDDLTGLVNRRGFYEQTDRLMKVADPRRPAALLLLDLDRFKEVNDALGHVAGDLLLSQVGRRIARAVRPADVAARLGGDEFAVLMPDTEPEEATLIAERILLALGKPFTLQTVTLHVEASIGVVNCPESAQSRSEALRCADVAMYQAKRTRSRIAVYTQHDDDPDRLRTVEELRSTIAGRNPERVGSIVVLFQPQLDLETGLPSGVEALVRWQHPERGLLGPGAFLPLAQAAGLMDALTNVVCELAMGACAQWWSLGLKMPVSINFPSSAVHDHALVTRIADLLDRHRLPPEAMTLEITEDMLMNDPPLAREVLTTLRALGVSVSVDDYGTGYSSLAYLRNLPVDELKLDRAFISDLTDDAGAAAIVQHVVSLAHSLGLRLVAEGIDDLGTVQALAAMGCDVGQGFFFARPMPAGQLLIWLSKDAVALRSLVLARSPAT
jgi:diguanylate cyclase (GGDEF)-like protein